MTMLQVITTIVFYLFLLGVMVLLYLIWRAGSTRILRVQQALIDVSNKAAEAARMAAEAAQAAVALLEKKDHAD